MQECAFIGYDAGAFQVTCWDEDGVPLPVVRLAIGDRLELWMSGDWQWAEVCSGGYGGWYYQTEAGLRGRFAVGMQVRVVRVAADRSEIGGSLLVVVAVVSNGLLCVAVIPSALVVPDWVRIEEWVSRKEELARAVSRRD